MWGLSEVGDESGSRLGVSVSEGRNLGDSRLSLRSTVRFDIWDQISAHLIVERTAPDFFSSSDYQILVRDFVSVRHFGRGRGGGGDGTSSLPSSA